MFKTTAVAALVALAFAAPAALAFAAPAALAFAAPAALAFAAPSLALWRLVAQSNLICQRPTATWPQISRLKPNSANTRDTFHKVLARRAQACSPVAMYSRRYTTEGSSVPMISTPITQ